MNQVDRVNKTNQVNQTIMPHQTFQIQLKLLPDHIYFQDMTDESVTFVSCWELEVDDMLMDTENKRIKMNEALLKTTEPRQIDMIERAAKRLAKQTNDPRVIKLIQSSEGEIFYQTDFYSGGRIEFRLEFVIFNWHRAWETL